MCYNATVSGSTFLFVAVVAVILWNRAKGIDRALAIVLLFIVFMQLIEWALWLQMPGCNPINKILSAAIPVYLALQPIIINLVVGWFGAGWAYGYEKVALLLAITLLPVQIYSALKGYGSMCTTVSSSGGQHLQWPLVLETESWLGGLVPPIYHLGMLYPLVTLKSPTFAGLYIFFSAVSLKKFRESNPNAWPSLWCHFVNMLAVFALVRS
jgi:hypothetical protein